MAANKLARKIPGLSMIYALTECTGRYARQVPPPVYLSQPTMTVSHQRSRMGAWSWGIQGGGVGGGGGVRTISCSLLKVRSRISSTDWTVVDDDPWNHEKYLKIKRLCTMNNTITAVYIYSIRVKNWAVMSPTAGCFTTYRKWGEGSIGGREYSCCNTSLLSRYENHCIITHISQYSWVVKIRNTSEAVLRPQYTPRPSYWALVSLIA